MRITIVFKGNEDNRKILKLVVMKNTIFFYAPCSTETLEFGDLGIKVCIGQTPERHLREYRFFGTYSNATFPKDWLNKLENKQILILGNGLPRYFYNEGIGYVETDTRADDETDVLEYKWTNLRKNEIEFEELEFPGETVKTQNERIKEIYSGGYTHSFKKVPQESEVFARDIEDNILIWKRDKFVWAALPSVAYFDANGLYGDTIDESAEVIGEIVHEILITKRADKPAWERELYSKLETELYKKNEVLLNEIFQNEEEIKKSEKIRSVCWETGKALEEAVRELFREVGINSSKRYRSDYIIENGGFTILAEVKSIEKNLGKISLPGIIAQINMHMTQWKAHEKENPKMLVVINHQYGTKPKERNPLDKECVRILSELFDCCVISTTELLRIREAILRGKLSPTDLLNKIMETEGELKLEPSLKFR